MQRVSFRLGLLSGVTLVAMACGPALVWQKPDGTNEQYRADDADCRSRAGSDAAATVVPGGIGIGSTYGSTMGTSQPLTPYPQGTTGPRSDLQVYRDCMQDRGYKLLPAPSTGG